MFTRLKRLYRNTIFRLSMIAAAQFALLSLFMLGYIYYTTVVSELNRVDIEISSELEDFAKIHSVLGPNGVHEQVILSMLPVRDSLYAYSYQGLPTGNLESLPPFSDNGKYNFLATLFGLNNLNARTFVYSPFSDNDDTTNIGVEKKTTHRARGQYIKLAENEFLFVARDVERLMVKSERITRSLIIAMVIAIAMGLLSGLFVASRFMRRVGRLNKLATDVRSGDLQRRAPRDASGDELDVLAEHLNDMLDHINHLMQAMRYAGDSIAHDLRSPLTRLKTRLESAAMETKDEAVRDTLLRSSDDASELLRTFESVLHIARLETGDRRELLLPLNPKVVIEDIAELYEPSCEDAGLDFALEIEGKHMVRADRGLLSQAVSNLVENAIKYTPRGGAITLRLRKIRSGRVEISVTDTGPGIPPDERQRVKERFVRLEKSRTLPGSGLGLSLVDAIADLHRAKFVLSDGPGGPDSRMPGLRAALVFPRMKKT